MTRRLSRYGRCLKCKELVIDPDNCANCAHRNPLSMSLRDERLYPIGLRDGFGGLNNGTSRGNLSQIEGDED